MKKFVFRDEITNNKYTIPILDGPAMDEESFFQTGFYEDKIVPEIEKRELETTFGIHDFATQGDDELFGFTTYEITEQEKWDELLNIWREILVFLGYQIRGTIQETEVD